MKKIILILILINLIQFSAIGKKTYYGDFLPDLYNYSDYSYIQPRYENKPHQEQGYRYAYCVSMNNELKVFSLTRDLEYDEKLEFISKYIDDPGFIISLNIYEIILNDGRKYDLQFSRFIDTLWTYNIGDMNNILFSKGFKRYVRYTNNESKPNETQIEFVNASNKLIIKKLNIPKPIKLYYLGIDTLYAFYENKLDIIKLENGKTIKTMQITTSKYGEVNLSEDGKYFSIASSADGIVLLYEILENSSKQIYYDGGTYYNEAARFRGSEISYGKFDSIIIYDYKTQIKKSRVISYSNSIVRLFDPWSNIVFFEGLKTSYNDNSSSLSYVAFDVVQMIGAYQSRNNSNRMAYMGRDETIVFNCSEYHPYPRVFSTPYFYYSYQGGNSKYSKNYAFSNDGRYFAMYFKYSSNPYTTIKILDLYYTPGLSNNEVTKINIYENFNFISDVFFVDNNSIEDDEKLVVCEMDGSMLLYDLNGNEIFRKSLPYKILRGFQYSNDGKKLLLICIDEQRSTHFFEYNIETDDLVLLFRDYYDRFFKIEPINKTRVALSSDYKYLSFAANQTSMVYVFDLGKAEIIASKYYNTPYPPVVFFTEEDNTLIYTDDNVISFDYLNNETKVLIQHDDYYFVLFQYDNVQNKKKFTNMVNYMFPKGKVYVKSGDNFLSFFKVDYTSTPDEKNDFESLAYPNPAYDLVNFEIGENVDLINVSVYTVSSNQIDRNKYSYYLNNRAVTLNCTNMPTGIYMVRLETTKGYIYQKFCKY